MTQRESEPRQVRAEQALIEAARRQVAGETDHGRDSAPQEHRPARDPASDHDSTTASLLLERLLRSRLIAAKQIDILRVELGEQDSEEAVVEALLQRGLVTAWQLDQVRKGEAVFYLDNGRYLLTAQIGQGGMGAVYRARHMRMNRDVAIKVIDPRRVKDRSLIDRFRREVAVSSKLQHEHIVHAYDVGMQGEISFLVLEYVEGSDLASLVKRDGPMEPDEAAAICMQAASGLAYAHGQGVVHRDIKPQNILLSTSGTTKLLDMGLARIVAEADEDSHTALTQEGAVMGTIDFMAPEQALNTHAADGRSDIYSLGATLYYLLTGRKPIPGGTAMEKLMRLAAEQPQPVGQLRPDCPRELTEIVEQMMAKRPQERFQTAEEVVRQLQPLAAEKISGRPVVTASVQSAADTHRATGLEMTLVTGPVFQPELGSVLASMRRGRKPSSPPKWMIGGAALLLALLLGGAIWQFNRPAAEPLPAPDLKPTPTSAHKAVPPAEYRRVLHGHFGVVLAGDWSPDGDYLATRGGDGQVRIWTADGTKTLAIYSGHTANVRHLVYSPDGRRIASTDARGEIQVWEAFSGKRIARIERPKALSNHGETRDGATFSPNGREIAYFDDANLVRYSLDEQRPVWSVPCLRYGPASYSPDGRHLAVGSPNSDGVHPLVWELSTGDLVYQHQPTGLQAFGGFTRENLLLVVTGKVLQLLKPESGDVVREWPLDGEYRTSGVQIFHGGEVCGLSRDLEGVYPTLVVNLASGKSTKLPTGILLSPDGSRYVGSDTSRRTIMRIDGTPINPDFGVVALPQPFNLELIGGRYLRSGRGWFDLAEVKMVSRFPDVSALLPDGRVRAIVEDRILEWSGVDALGGEFRVVCELEDADAYVGIRWTDDGSQLWGSRLDGLFFHSLRFWDPEDGTVIRNVESSHLKKAHAQSYQIHFSNTGNVLAAACAGGQTIWAFDGGQAPRQHEIGTYTTASLSPNGRLLAGVMFGDGFDVFHVYDTISGEPRGTVKTGLGNFHEYQTLARFSPTGDYLLTVRQVWDVREGEPKRLWECPERSSAVGPMTPTRYNYHNCAWLPDEDHVLICQDAQYQVWNWRNNEKLLTLFMLPGTRWAAVNHQNGYWTGTPLAYRDLRCRLETEDGKTEWVTPREYEQRTGFQRDPSQVGLDFLTQQPGPPAGEL